MAYQEALRSLLRYVNQGRGENGGPCVPFSVECLFPSRVNLPPRFYALAGERGMAVEEIIPPLTQAGILYVTEFNTPLTADSKRTLREVLDDPAIPGILVRELAQEESHLFSVQGPATRILGRYRVYDTGTRKLSYYAWAGSILKRALTRVPDEQYIGVVHKGPNWGDQKALRRLGGKV